MQLQKLGGGVARVRRKYHLSSTHPTRPSRVVLNEQQRRASGGG